MAQLLALEGQRPNDQLVIIGLFFPIVLYLLFFVDLLLTWMLNFLMFCIGSVNGSSCLICVLFNGEPCFNSML